MTTKNHRKTQATRAKLERALIQLESFLDADNFDRVTRADERVKLREAYRSIQDVESRLYQETQ